MDTERRIPQLMTDLPSVAEQLLEIVPRLRGLIAAEAQAEAAALSITQWRVLGLLRCRQRLPSELARELKVTPATVSEVVDNLVRRRLVERGEEPDDRRSIPLNITAEGLSVWEAARGRALAGLQRTLERLNPGDLSELGRLLCLLQEALEEVGAGERSGRAY